MPPVCQDWKCVIQWMNDNPGVAGWVQGLTALIAVLIALWIATRQLGDALKLEAARRNADKRTRIEGLAALASSGAKLLAKVGGLTLTREVNPTRSYLAQSESVMTFGLGKNRKIDSLDILWPSGQKQTIMPDKVDTLLTIEEPR